MLPPKLKTGAARVGLLLFLFNCYSECVTADEFDAASPHQFVECLSCDSELDKNCALQPQEVTTKEMCRHQCMTAVYPMGDENSLNYRLVRGCLYDRDLDDRVICSAGGNDKCMSCTGDNCNDHVLKEEIYNCYHCEDDQCEDPEEHECVTLSGHAQCYIRFDERTNDLVAMGCLTDFANEEAIMKLIKQKLLYVCDGEYCNSYENIPRPNECTKCNSNTTESCATKPTTTNSRSTCKVVPYTQCYQRVSEEHGGVTERGCLSELEGEDFYNCYTNADDNCKICTGESCNIEIIPADRLQCQRCDSETDSNCQSAPTALSVCPKYDAKDACAAVLEGSITRRGCRSEFSCNVNSQNCQLCADTGCNIANLKRRSEEIYGAFQDLPLNCNTCSGEECLTGLRNPRKCEGDIFQDCITVFDESGQVIRRGCEALVESEYQSYCASRPELCFNCKSNGCNTVTDKDTYQQCLYCDAAENPDCLFNPESISTTRKCVEGCLAALYPRKNNSGVYDFVRSCFEDIEPDDRDDCTPEGNCVKCTNGDSCNTQILPDEGRLSCLHCDGDDCNQPMSRECIGFSQNDQCYILFDEVTFSAIRMGCTNEYTQQEIEADIKHFFLCDGENCNSYENLPEAKICYACNSLSDENCAVDPAKVTVQSRCQIHPHTDCYSRIRADGHTDRGCLYNLPIDDFVNCRNGDTDAICRICSENNCNGGIYPSNRQRCYRCNSTYDADCETDPQITQACPLYQDEDSCVTKLIAGVTHRGCGSEFNCTDASRKSCSSCIDFNCNTVNLIDDFIGDPGVFQTLPLNCYHCDGSAECDSTVGIVRKCEGDKLQTCTVAFARNGSVVARGCSDLVDPLCSDGDNMCYDCKSNGCNLVSDEQDYVDCVFCDAQLDPNCVFNSSAVKRTRQCYKRCMTALYPRTSDPSPVYEVMRTCLDDMDLDERESCAAGQDSKCKACNDAKCNLDDVGVRKSCYHCTGDDCQNPVRQTCRGTMDHDQCFVQFDETSSIVEMGCKSKYDPPEVKLLVSAKRLWLCDEDNCNTFDNLPQSQLCAICNSKTDAACATAPSSVSSETRCATEPFTQCYSRILSDGHTERGCLSSLEGEQFYSCYSGDNATQCISCTGNGCNRKLYPEDRRSCYVCTEDASNSCDTIPESPEICRKYSPNEQCVSLLNEDGQTVRGCSSQLTCDPTDTVNCQICDGNDCNRSNLKRKIDGRPGLWQPLPLSCRSCDGEVNCRSSSGQSDTCSEAEYCMTVFSETGVVIRRGCSNAVELQLGSYCDSNSANCHNCNSNDCNSATSLSDYVECIYCDSEHSAKCVSQPEDVSSRRMCHKICMTALYPRKANDSVYELTRSCLDDKDAADASKCQVGDAFCAACEGAACNTKLLPPDRLSCYSCEGDSCEDPQSGFCPRYKEIDQCFMLFNEESDVVQMGCVSDLAEAFVESNIHLLFICGESDNCNNFANLPQPKLCTICNSNDDPQCATEPESIPMTVQCTALPNTQCYTRVLSDGSTSRGCVNSLSQSEMRSCLSGNSTSCTICPDDKCNVQIYPADRRRCHRCNTKEDPNCESAPQASAVCPFYSPNEFCTAKLVNGDTYRDCSSEFQCDDTDKQYCRQCSGTDNCNVVDLVSSNIGYPGKWQGVPINCYTCNGTECQGTSLGVVRKCEGNTEQNCGVVFANSGAVLQRGCSDLIYEAGHTLYCDENPTFCKFCKSNGCNLARSVADYVDCVFCDGTDSRDCVSDVTKVTRTRSCHQQCLTGLYPRTEETDPAYELARGCLDDLDLDDREACEQGKKPYCQACEGTTCNKQAIPETRLKCLVCENCEDPTSLECTAFREHDQCFTFFDSSNNIERMGCASDLDTSYITAKRRQLLLCEGDDCNTFENLPSPVACAICDSISQPNCAIDPSKGILAAVCNDLPNTQCYTHVDQSGITHRGCLSDAADHVFYDCISGNSTTCVTCHENGCNMDIYPAGRRSCHRCSSADDPTCEDSPQSFASICPVYSESDTCVTKIETDYIRRGCSSDFTCNAEDRDTCRICDSDNCNTVNLLAGYIGEPGKWQALPLNCYSCDGAECSSGSGVVRKCEGNMLQTCVTVFGANGAVQKRGCSDAVHETHAEYCEDQADKCIGCKSNGCNNATSLNDFVDCYFCDSADSSTCSVNLASSTRTRKCQKSCMVALYPRSISNYPAFETSRSCLDDLDLDDRESCAAGENDLCIACEESRCNDVALPKDRYECYKCVGDDCEDPIAQPCNAYHASDQCYIVYDSENSIAAMGCRSEFEMEVVTELIKQKRMILCSGKNCNDLESMPKPRICSVCTSENDTLCATNPHLVQNPQRCTALPYTDCYTRVDEESGHTERGCLSSLDSEIFYGCLMGTDGLCETCSGDKCNEIGIFPADRFRCHQCNSATEPECGASPNSNTVCPIYRENDACVTNLRDGITTRGCASSYRCDDQSDRRRCRVCTTSGCNTVNLEKISSDGEPGRWQDIPLSCYTCADEEECEESLGVFRVCENNPYQNCMTVFNTIGKVIQRGCADIVNEGNEEYCNTNPESCVGCTSNGCNLATSLDDYVECLHCDTEANGDCVNNVGEIRKTRKCYQNCMVALYPREHEENPAYGLSRSCYDDMDLDDRDACAAGEKEFCQVCSEPKCNVAAMPEQRLSCNICIDDDCQAPKPTTCPTYRLNDTCYIRFDEQHSIVAMGCRSEFSNSEADYLLSQKRLLFCEGENCNTFDSLPTSQSCALCNSRTDLNCAVAPAQIESVTTCAVLPYTQCYSRVLTDGATERGCLSNLYDEEFLGCLNGTSSTCKACTGNKCNNDLFPEGRASCHICDSSSDNSCEARPNRLSICPRYAAEETCVTVYRDDITYRGCSSSLSCDSTNPRLCSKCTGDGCNTVNLARKQDDNFGKWQDLPLRCLSCNVTDCDSIANLPVLTCANNNEQDCVTVFDASGKVVRRGCTDEVEAEFDLYCDANPDNCYNCKSNECNIAVAKTDFTDCIYCDSNRNQECVWNPLNSTHKTRKCQGGCMTALYPSDSSSNPAYDLIRTCSNDKERSDETTCLSGQDANCQACTNANCNIVDLPDNRLHCYICTDDDCEDPSSKICPLYRKDDQCFTWFDESNSVSQMGCLSSFRNQDLESIIKSKRVYVCSGENCNGLDRVPSAQKCAVCDSKSNVFCATDANEVGTFNTCTDLPYTSCYSKLTEDGATVRGCLADLPADDFAACLLGNDKNCGVCEGDGCNREVFPADRQQCNTCSSLDDPGCESFPTRKQACPVVSETESCITALSGNVTLRGCSSELFCDSTDSFSCRSCFGTSCNSIDLRNKVDDGYHGVWQQLPLKCHTCVGEHCHDSLGPTVSCTNNLKQDCMTVFNENGEVIRRGCEDPVEDYEDLHCRQHPELCFKCKSNECNIAWNLTEYTQCAFCLSENDPLCAINPQSSGIATRSCYKECMVALNNGETIRSCLDDKELRTQHVCRANESGKECASCEGDGCNKFVYPADRLLCHVCSGAACTGSLAQYCRLYTEDDACFAKYEQGRVDLMGCISSQNSSDVDDWTQQKKLFRCTGNECNDLRNLPVTGDCLSCDSSTTPACAQNPLTVNTNQTCLAPVSTCVTRVNSAGNTLRGCFSALSELEQNTCVREGTCSTCEGNRCNNNVFPVSRRKCYICNSNQESSCTKDIAKLQINVCPVYAASDRCVTKRTDKLIERGCATDFTCNVADNNNCRICDTDGCNNHDLSGAGFLTSSFLLTSVLAFVAIMGLKDQI